MRRLEDELAEAGEVGEIDLPGLGRVTVVPEGMPDPADELDDELHEPGAGTPPAPAPAPPKYSSGLGIDHGGRLAFRDRQEGTTT